MADPTPTPARTEQILEAILARLNRIEAKLDARGGRGRMSRRNRELLARLLPAIAGWKGSELFLASEVTNTDVPALRVVRGDLTTKQIGWLFRNSDGGVIDGYCVIADGEEAGAILWRVMKSDAS